MTDREAMQQALEALETGDVPTPQNVGKNLDAITAIKEALAQPEQEPKCGAIIEVFGKDWRLEYMSLPVGKHKLYTQQYIYTAPQPQMQPCAGRNCGSTNPNLHSAECFEDYEKSTGMSQWQRLTEEEINNSYLFWIVDQQDVIGFGRSIETKLKRKNT